MYARHFRSSAPAAKLNWSGWVRQFHRWTSIVFVLSVIATSVALAQKAPIVWMSYVPLFPLALRYLLPSPRMSQRGSAPVSSMNRRRVWAGITSPTSS